MHRWGHHPWAGRARRVRFVWGAFFLAWGLWWLLGEMNQVPFEWAWVGALALIFVGLSMLVGGAGSWGHHGGWGPEERYESEGIRRPRPPRKR